MQEIEEITNKLASMSDKNRNIKIAKMLLEDLRNS